MRVNVFKGARRLAAVVGGTWLIACVTHVLVSDHTGTLTYIVPGPGEAPVIGNKCHPDDAREYTRVDFGKGEKVNVTFCFLAHDASDGRRLVPYAHETVSVSFPDGTVVEGIPKGMSEAELMQHLRTAGYDVQKLLGGQHLLDPNMQTPKTKKLRYYAMNDKHSPEVVAYATEFSRAFMLPPEGVAAASTANRQARIAAYKEMAIVAATGLGLGWLLMTATGWIVRGFLNIPRGRDEAA